MDSKPKKIIIDTDVGIDDALAIIVTLENASVPIMAMTIVEGNVDVPEAYRNAHLIKHICGKPEIPIYPGAHGPLIQGIFPTCRWPGHGKDGLGDFTETQEFQEFQKNHLQGVDVSVPSKTELVSNLTQAANALVEAVKTEPANTIQLIALGPLTNLALAIHIYPDFISRLHSLVVMGGCLLARGNVSRTAEFNVHYDPEAAYTVFHACERVERLRIKKTTSHSNPRKPLMVLVPWETTVEGGVPWTFYDELERVTALSASGTDCIMISDDSVSTHKKAIPQRKRVISSFIHGICSSAETKSRHVHERLRSLPSRSSHQDYLFQAHSFVMPDLHAILVALYEADVVEDYTDWNVQVELQGLGTRGMTHVEWWASSLSVAAPKDNYKDSSQVNSVESDPEPDLPCNNARIITKLNQKFIQKILTNTFLESI